MDIETNSYVYTITKNTRNFVRHILLKDRKFYSVFPAKYMSTTFCTNKLQFWLHLELFSQSTIGM